MESKVQLDLDYSSMKLGLHNQLVMPEIYEPVADHLIKIKAMEIRDDDVVLCSYPKCGTHWLYRTIDMLQRGRAVYDKRSLTSTFIDLQLIERMVELDSPRLLVTHVPFDLLPQQVKDKRTKIVHVYRDPRAMLVSMHFHMTAWKKDKDDCTLDKLGERLFNGKLSYTGWFNYMDAVLAFEKKNPDQPIFHIAYEDMTLNPLEAVKSLAEFLGKTGTQELYSGIVEACSFKKQKESEETTGAKTGPMKFYRKGDMNDWKNYLTVALKERIDEALTARARNCPFSAKYSNSACYTQSPSL